MSLNGPGAVIACSDLSHLLTNTVGCASSSTAKTTNTTADSDQKSRRPGVPAFRWVASAVAAVKRSSAALSHVPGISSR